jgi:hypothetical protein
VNDTCDQADIAQLRFDTKESKAITHVVKICQKRERGSDRDREGERSKSQSSNLAKLSLIDHNILNTHQKTNNCYSTFKNLLLPLKTQMVMSTYFTS